MDKRTEKESFLGQTAICTSVILKKIICMERVVTNGPMAESTTVNGTSIKCTVTGLSRGQTDVNTMDSTIKIKKKAEEYSSGLMVANLMEVGKTGCRMELLVTLR